MSADNDRRPSLFVSRLLFPDFCRKGS